MGTFSKATIEWTPFTICAPSEKAPYPRSLNTPEGLGDRLRFVAFAEKQAENAFRHAAHSYPGLPDSVKNTWLALSMEEAKHLQWLLERMKELGVDPAERPQSLALWNSFDRCTTAMEFALFMANAEERGRIAGEQFHETLMKSDPVTGELFRRIAEEEKVHIELARSVMKALTD
ncbi:MAG: ferritin-like domain-containing protein [Bdellovibrionales bacterium]|nr:ferritin-like domain-containing protein [Bdellovibrionales bacterium]